MFIKICVTSININLIRRHNFTIQMYVHAVSNIEFTVKTNIILFIISFA